MFIVNPNKALNKITTRTYNRNAITVITIALKKPTLWLILIINHVAINATNHASHPPRKRKTIAKVTVIKKAVKKTCPNSVCLALLKNPKANFMKIAIINRTIR